jgi:hypothetical protein
MNAKLLVSRIREAASVRPAGYVEDVLSRGTIYVVDGVEILELPQEEMDALRLKYKDYPPPPPRSIPKALSTPDLSRTDTPSFLEKVKNFAVSSAQHVVNGMPMCSDEEIIRRHDICRGCEFFKDNTCGKCGCPLSRAKGYVSKLSWADQECPVGKWGRVDGK